MVYYVEVDESRICRLEMDDTNGFDVNTVKMVEDEEVGSPYDIDFDITEEKK